MTVCRVKFTRKLHQEYSKVISRLAAIAKLSFFFLQLKRDLFTRVIVDLGPLTTNTRVYLLDLIHGMGNGNVRK